MKANEYIKENGLEEACQLLEMGRGFVKLSDDGGFHTDDLKRLVESHEIVEKLGGLDNCKRILHELDCTGRTNAKIVLGDGFIDVVAEFLRKDISDVEACQ